MGCVEAGAERMKVSVSSAEVVSEFLVVGLSFRMYASTSLCFPIVPAAVPGTVSFAVNVYILGFCAIFELGLFENG